MFITTITTITKDSMTNTATELTKFMPKKRALLCPLLLTNMHQNITHNGRRAHFDLWISDDQC